MKRLIKTTLLPALLLAGLALADSPTAQAGGPFGRGIMSRGPFPPTPMSVIRARRAAKATVVHHVSPVTYVTPTVVTRHVPVVTKSVVVNPVVTHPVVTHRVAYPVVVPTYTTTHYGSYYISY